MDSKCSERAAGEKAARMQPSANGTGLEGANRKFATGSRVQPQLNEKTPVKRRSFFILNMQIFSFRTRSAVSAPPGEKAAWIQPSANGTGLEGANRRFATGSRVQPQLTYNKENLPKINLPRV